MLIESYNERQSRHDKNVSIILKFLRDEIWSNAENLAVLLCVTKTAIYKTIKKLIKLDYIKVHYVAELRFNIWGITSTGLLFSWDESEIMEDRYYFETSKVRPVMIQHHLDLQKARFKAEKESWSNWVLGQKLPKHIEKRPDAIVKKVSSNEIIAVELERIIKTKKRYEVIFAIYLQAIKRNEYNFIHYVCPDGEFAKRLERMFFLIKSVPVAGQRVQLLDKHRAKFLVFSLDNWPPKT